jgi:general stress protein 26
MKIETQSNSDMAKVAELIKDMSVALLTSTSEDSALVMRPMSPLMIDGSGAIWFFTDLRSAKVEQLRHVNLSFSNEADSTYVSLSGHGEIHNDRTKIKQLWTPFAKPWFPDGPDSPDLALLRFAPDSAEYWDAPSSKMLRMFGMVASIVTSKPIGLGEHDLLTGLSAQTAQ